MLMPLLDWLLQSQPALPFWAKSKWRWCYRQYSASDEIHSDWWLCFQPSMFMCHAYVRQINESCVCTYDSSAYKLNILTSDVICMNLRSKVGGGPLYVYTLLRSCCRVESPTHHEVCHTHTDVLVSPKSELSSSPAQKLNSFLGDTSI